METLTLSFLAWHDFRDYLNLFLVAAFLVAAWRLRGRLRDANVTRLTWLSITLAVFCCVLFFGISAGYLVFPNYLDHVEPCVAAIAAWIGRGNTLYPSWQDGEGFYGLVYGPVLFQLTSAFLAIHASIFMSKLLAWLCFWASPILLAIGLRPVVGKPSLSVAVIVAAVLLLVAPYGHSIYWNRPEPFLLLLPCIGFICYMRLSGLAAVLTIGVVAGAAVGFKLHAAVYLMPFALGILGAEPTLKRRFWLIVAGSLAGAAAVAAPFLDPRVSLGGFLGYLQAASNQGLSSHEVGRVVPVALVLLVPWVLLAAMRQWTLSTRDRWLVWSYPVAVVVVCVVASKPGAGPLHLTPFLPYFAYLLALAGSFFDRDTPGRVRPHLLIVAVFMALLLSHGPTFLNEQRLLVAEYSTYEEERAVYKEAEQWYASYPKAEMGIGTRETYPKTNYRVLGAFGDTDLRISAPALMELQLADAVGPNIYALVENCSGTQWLIPSGGRPFSMNSYYDSMTLFDDRFQEEFERNFEQAAVGKHFSLWVCK